ncbi:MAG: bacterial Ig-like domain-containing protein, partial [Clostridia bacterium]|nr:bacterial Ig-like domain-containing protein [Clostridia bacterium]
MLRILLIFLLSLIIALGSTVFMYKSEVDGMIQMGQDKLDEIINGEKPDDPDDPSGGEDELKVESIALDTTGAKLEFAFGEKFSAEGLKVIATYVDGSKKEIAIEDCKLVKPDTTKPGDRQVTVVYEGKSARYNVTINIKVIPTISSTPLVEIVGKNDSVPYRVEAELIDMVTPGVVKAEGYDSFVAEAPADADITGGDQYLTGYGVAWNYFGFTFTAAEKFEGTTLVLRVANSTGKSIDAGIIKMYLNFSQDENGVSSGEIPLDGYIIPADGACKWMDIVIRNVTIPEGTNTLTFETQKDNAFDIDYVDFYVGMRYVNSVVEIVDSTTIVKDLESLDTEKAFTRDDVANAHGLKPGQLFVETVSKPIDGQVTSGGTSVGAIGKGSQISTTIRVAQDSTVRILFKASAVGKGAYNVADNWNFYIDGVKINIVEVKNIEGGNQAEGQWWDWKYTNIGEINLPAGDHYFLLEVHGTDCNVDTVEFEVVSFGSFDESGTNIEDMYVPEEIPEADINIDKKGEFVFEAENLDMSNLTPSAGQTAVGVETPSGDGPATSGGKSLGLAGGGYASFTFKLNDKATIQIYGVLAHAHGGEAATFMSAKLNDTDLALSGTLPVGTGSMPYWNWANIPFGEAVELEAGTYTLTVNFLSNPNVDCFKINVLSYGEEEEGFKVTVEAETFDNEGVVTRQDMIDAGRIPAGQYMSETGNGATCICGFTAGTWFKFNVNLEEAKLIEMFLVGATDAGGYDVSTKFTLKVNGNDVVIPSGSITGSGATPYWDWQTVSLGKFNLNAGDNEIVLTIVDGHPNLDKVFFVEVSEEPVTPPTHECESVCPECGKCLDAECAEDACAEKCEGH